MGVRGLTTYIDARPFLTKPHKLHDTKVVIDGNNLIHFLYASKELDCVHGGDYFRYADEVKKYFACFEECNIKVVIVLDGAHDVSDYLFPKRRERFLSRLEGVKKTSETATHEQTFIPINLFEVFKNIISELGITLIQCDNESDNHIAALANHYGCPVLSNDSDFYVYDVKRGFITFSCIETTVCKDTDAASKYLKCRIYYLREFLSDLPGIGENKLPLLATLIGNDFLSYEDLRPFYKNIRFKPRQRIDGIIKWLSKRQRDDAIREVLQYIRFEDREKIKSLIKVSTESYKLGTSSLANILDKKKNCIDEVLLNSKLVTRCGELLPKEFIIAFSEGRSRGDFLNIINSHRLILSAQVEDFKSKSSYDCSQYIRRVLYGILLQHDTQNENVHNSICMQGVEEYGHSNGEEMIIRVDPVFSLISGKCLPKLNEIYSISRDVRQKILLEVMGVEDSFMLYFNSNLQLFFGTIIYWLKNCLPKHFKEFLVALIICLTYFQVLKELCIEITPETSTDMEIPTSYLAELQRISKSEKQAIINNIMPYLNAPFHNDIFNVKIVHSYSQLQTCLLYMISLNELLDFPFKPPNLHEMFEGTLLYNLTKALLESRHSELFLEHLFGKKNAFVKLVPILLERIFKNLPKDFV